MALAGDQVAGFAYSFPIALGGVPVEVNQLVRVPFTVTNKGADTAYLSTVAPKTSGVPAATGGWGMPLPNRSIAAGASVSSSFGVVGFAAGDLVVGFEAVDWRGSDATFDWELADQAVGVLATFNIVPVGWTR